MGFGFRRDQMYPTGHALPMSRAEMEARGQAELDVLLVTGDAYVDHPSFGVAIIGRLLEAQGFSVGIVAQPRIDRLDDILALGRPRLFVGVTAGNIDSMLCHLTAQRQPRRTDDYSPNGEPNRRPRRASIVYAQLCRRAFHGLPVILGGLEASLRRVAHYDYMSDSVHRSLLLDAKADFLVYGMAEHTISALSQGLAAGAPRAELEQIRGLAYRISPRSDREHLLESSPTSPDELLVLPSTEEVTRDPQAFAAMTRMLDLEHNPFSARRIFQSHEREGVMINPPSLPLSTAELDKVAALPFTRRPHPRYQNDRIPAFETVRHSVVTSRGCFGGCRFCSITAHAGRTVQSRSQDSIVAELEALASAPGFSGTISDLGAPTANMYGLGCTAPERARSCRRRSCLVPSPCPHLNRDQQPFRLLLERARGVRGVRHVFLASGIRHDLALESPQLIADLARHHTGGQLSVAPEHVNPQVLAHMGKPPISLYLKFAERFAQCSERADKQQYLVPYFLVGHPGSTLTDTLELALFLKAEGLRPRQVQQFIPTPMTAATAMYHTGLDPFTLQPVPVAKGGRERRLMKALALYYQPEMAADVREALKRLGRTDLIGTGPRALVCPLDVRAPRQTARGTPPRDGTRSSPKGRFGKRS